MVETEIFYDPSPNGINSQIFDDAIKPAVTPDANPNDPTTTQQGWMIKKVLSPITSSMTRTIRYFSHGLNPLPVIREIYNQEVTYNLNTPRQIRLVH